MWSGTQLHRNYTGLANMACTHIIIGQACALLCGVALSYTGLTNTACTHTLVRPVHCYVEWARVSIGTHYSRSLSVLPWLHYSGVGFQFRVATDTALVIQAVVFLLVWYSVWNSKNKKLKIHCRETRGVTR